MAALYDIHGNLPALEAVLTEVDREGVDAIVCGGDLLWGPMPAECLDVLLGRKTLFIRGNADRDAVAGEDEIDRYCSARLGAAEKARVADWPLTLELDLPGSGRVLFCHATPRSDEEIVTRDTPDEAVAEALADIEAALVVCGHTHVQFDRRPPGSPRLVNAGSVGMPYEGDPAARWALLGKKLEFRRTTYDVEDAISAILHTGMPQAERIVVNALQGGVDPEEAVSFFESQRANPHGA